MRTFAIICLSGWVVLFGTSVCNAQMKTDKDLVNEIITNLQTGDDSMFGEQFPKFQFLQQLVYAYQPADEYQGERIYKLKGKFNELKKFDPEFNPKLLGMFHFARDKASDSGMHWSDILIARYVLDKQFLPRELIGFEYIAPIRLSGYIFVQDMLTRRKYCIAVRDIMLLEDKWYGGTVLNILEASTIPEYEERLMQEEEEMRKLMIAKQNGTLDSILALKDSVRQSKIKVSMSDDEDKQNTIFKDVMDRKVYWGYFDNQLPVDLYVRFIKGACPETICEWEAMYKLDDIDEYIILDVTRNEDGTFIMTEEDVGVMELKLEGNTFTGTWTSFSDKTEYEVYLKEKDGVKPKKLFKLDKIFEESNF